MSIDTKLRSTRRQADRSSDPLDLARVLVERLRGGTIDPERVALAAYCGSEAARLALFGSFNPPVYEVPPALIEVACAPFDSVDLTPDSVGRLPSPLPRQFDLAKWLSGLSRWQSHPYSAPVRAALAAAEAVYPHFVESMKREVGTHTVCANPRYPGQSHKAAVEASCAEWVAGRTTPVRRALDAVAARLADPSEDRRLEACRAWLSARPVDGGLSGLWIPCPTSRAEGGWGLERPWTPGAVDVAEWNARAPSEAARLHPSGEPAIREVIQRALVAWALG